MSFYLDLLEKALLGTLYNDPPMDPWSGRVSDADGKPVEFGKAPGTFFIEPGPFDAKKRELGLDWPATAHTMIGAKRLRQLRLACETVLRESIPGDFIETGVWRGGACILMAGVLREWPALAGDRRVFVADSFEGLPTPDPKYAPDKDDWHHAVGAMLAIDEKQVRQNFEQYDLLDENVVFLPGWFKDTLPSIPSDTLSIVRLDGDMYGSTVDAIVPLWPRLSPGGYLIVDDYHAVKGCKMAIDDFRDAAGIDTPMIEIDGKGVYWRKA